MANKSGNENVTNTMDQISPLPIGVAVYFSVLLALNIFFSITASLGNAVSLIALRKVSSVHPPTKLLFQCLVVSDLCVGLLLQPLFATRLLNKVTKKINSNDFMDIIDANSALSLVLCGISLLTSTAISVDRLLALMLGLRYRNAMTLKRVGFAIFCIWVISISFGLISYFVSLRIAFTGAIVWALFSLLLSMSSYTKIFLRLRQQQAQVQDLSQQVHQNEGGVPLSIASIARYKRTVASIAWVQMALVACYAPLVIWSMLNNYKPRHNDMSWNATVTLFYLNSSLNPLLYCWKIAQMKRAVKDTLTQFCCASI